MKEIFLPNKWMCANDDEQQKWNFMFLRWGNVNTKLNEWFNENVICHFPRKWCERSPKKKEKKFITFACNYFACVMPTSTIISFPICAQQISFKTYQNTKKH